MTSSTSVPIVKIGNTAFSQIDTSGVDHAHALRKTSPSAAARPVPRTKTSVAIRIAGFSIASRRFGRPARIGPLVAFPLPPVLHGGEAMAEVRQDGPHVVGSKRPARPQ